jgi:hypothetical protein
MVQPGSVVGMIVDGIFLQPWATVFSARVLVMMVGLAGMFIASFRMIIRRFVTLKAFIETNPGMAIILGYRSTAPVFSEPN